MVKRGLEPGDASTSASGTPLFGGFRAPRPPSLNKRPKMEGQKTPFLRGDTLIPQETPGSLACAIKADCWPTSAQRKFESFGLGRTPSCDSSGLVGLPPLLRNDSISFNNCGPLSASQISSAAQCAIPNAAEDEEDDGFVLFSQAEYIRGSQAVGTPNMTPHDDTTQVALVSQNDARGLLEDGDVVIVSEEGPSTRSVAGQRTDPNVYSVDEILDAHGSGTDGNVHVDSQSVVLLSQPEQQLIPAISAPRPCQQANEAHAVTPDLTGGCGGVTGGGTGGGAFSREENDAGSVEPMSVRRGGKAAALLPMMPKMFNIFLPKSQQRHIILIRHGESEYNRAMVEGKDFKDPMIFDPWLTTRGIAQARELRSKLAHQLSVHGEALWVVSPLRRALQTFMEACPLLHGAASGALCSASLSSTPASLSPSAAQALSSIGSLTSNESSSMTIPLSSQGVARAQTVSTGPLSTPRTCAVAGDCSSSGPPVKYEIMPLISEFVVTAGDVGSTASALAKDFPELAGELHKVPEQWWYQAPRKTNCAVLKQLNSLEPKEHRQKRVSELARWLSTRPEKFIIMIGHCSFWHEFRGRSEKRMNNGEMRFMRW